MFMAELEGGLVKFTAGHRGDEFDPLARRTEMLGLTSSVSGPADSSMLTI
jgi:hypothetical protein